mmetsp:Transcript_42661/g.103595  ORF Transcript_42661/g.103595 Transcript_42661/m.103595 type:complete len:142 (-) Transcript_42661:581-1006(-)
MKNPYRHSSQILAMHALETNIPIVAKIEERMQSMSMQSGGTGPKAAPKRTETSRYPTSDTSPRYILAKPTWDDDPPSTAFASSSPVSESRTHPDAAASDVMNDAPSATSDVANDAALSERSSERTRRSKDKADSDIKSAFF